MPDGWQGVYKWLAGVGGAVLMAGVLTALASLSKLLKRHLVSSFADVVRYLDTTPRSYAMRRNIRQGFVELLNGLHNAKYGGNDRYDRIIVVAHSLGAYIAYDGISYLWAQKNDAAGEKEPMDTGSALIASLKRRVERATPLPQHHADKQGPVPPMKQPRR